MITRLGPGWLCQPNVPPGAIVFCRTWRSETPFVLIRACQKSVAVPELMSVFVVASMSSKRPTPIVVVVTRRGVVARTVPAYNAPPAAQARRAQSHFLFMSPPCLFEVESGRVLGRRARALRRARAPCRVPRARDAGLLRRGSPRRLRGLRTRTRTEAPSRPSARETRNPPLNQGKIPARGRQRS